MKPPGGKVIKIEKTLPQNNRSCIECYINWPDAAIFHAVQTSPILLSKICWLHSAR